MKMVKNMVKVHLLLLMEAIIKENLLKTKLLVMVNIIGKMVNPTKDNGIIVK